MKDLLRIRDFRLLFVGQAGSNWGDALTNITLLILTQRLTGSVAAVAGTAIAVALPQLLLGMLAGVYVDRWDRKRVMVISDVARAVLVLGFVFITSAAQIWLMYAIAFIQAAVGAFFNPAKGALIPALVGRERLLAANSAMETTRIIVGLAGTAAAGLWAGLVGDLWPIFLVDAITFLGSAWLVQLIATESAGHPSSATGGVWREMVIGIRAATTSRILVGVMVGAGVVMFGLGAVNVLLVPFVIEDLAVSETWFGALEGAQVSSMVMAGALVTVLAARFRPSRVITVTLLGVGVIVASISLVENVWQFLLVLFAVGWMVTPLQASVSTLVQSETPDALRGRVGSALGTVIGTANVSSMALAGVSAVWLGVRGVFLLAGAIACLAGILTSVLFRGADAPTPVAGPVA
ncbi:MAG TPA: MFS transporter [Acidimicrobiia bacterium]|nr:MFS transporter [Acidimicrobiia bacterium]